MKTKQMELLGFIKLSEVSCQHCQKLCGVVSRLGACVALPLPVCWGTHGVPVGCAPTASQEPAQQSRRSVGGVDISIRFGLGRSFWSLSLLKWISLGAPPPVPVVQSWVNKPDPFCMQLFQKCSRGLLKRHCLLFLVYLQGFTAERQSFGFIFPCLHVVLLF